MILVAVVCCVLAVTANAAVVPSFSIQPLSAPLALTGFTDCGVAQIVDISLTGCTTAPCQLSSGSSYTLAIDFKPRDQHWDLRHRAVLIKDTQLVELSDGLLPDSTVYPDQTYKFDYPFVASGVSGTGEFRLIVHQNYIQEICVVIPVTIN